MDSQRDDFIEYIIKHFSSSSYPKTFLIIKLLEFLCLNFTE